MRMKDLDAILELKRSLEDADQVLAAFRAMPGPTVPCAAHSDSLTSYGRVTRVAVALPPVPLSTAISAAERDRSKIIGQLQQLGVQVDP